MREPKGAGAGGEGGLLSKVVSDLCPKGQIGLVSTGGTMEKPMYRHSDKREHNCS